MKSSKKGIQIILSKFAGILASDPLDDETEYGDGYWFYLKPGFINTADGMHMVHEMTIASCYGKLSNVKPCNCEDCVRSSRATLRPTKKPYPVITRNVIIEALDWSGIPAPKMLLNGSYNWPNGSTSCSYILEWKRADVEAAIGEQITHDGSAGYSRFLSRFQWSFCSDVTVVNLYSQQGEYMRAEIYCKIQPHGE